MIATFGQYEYLVRRQGTLLRIPPLSLGVVQVYWSDGLESEQIFN